MAELNTPYAHSPLNHREQNDGCSHAHHPLHILSNDSQICALSRFLLYYPSYIEYSSVLTLISPPATILSVFFISSLDRPLLTLFSSPFSKCLHWWFISLVCSSTPSFSNLFFEVYPAYSFLSRRFSIS